MGLYDDVVVEFPLPDGWQSLTLQSKDGPCELQTIRLTWAGMFYDRNSGTRQIDPDAPQSPHWQRVAYDGEFLFYDGDHRYVAVFDQGGLTELRMEEER